MQHKDRWKMLLRRCEARRLIGSADRELVEIVALSLRVSLSAVAFAALIGLPLASYRINGEQLFFPNAAQAGA